jgi:hypothetical protein
MESRKKKIHIIAVEKGKGEILYVDEGKHL